MPFDTKYKPNGYTLYGGILPFFGFKKDTDTTFYTQGVYVPDSDTLSGKRKEYRTHSREEEIYIRETTPSGKELMLENRFLILAKYDQRFQSSSSGSKQFDPFQTPYKCTSLEEYYNSVYTYRPSPSFLPLLIIAVVLCAIWFLPYSYIFPFFEQRFGYEMGCAIYVFPVPVIVILITLIIQKIRMGVYNRRKKAIPKLSSLSYTEKAAVREKYLADMDVRYGKDYGDILREYAILKGYDR